MKIRARKLLSAMLAPAMLCGLLVALPFTASAAGAVCKIGSVTYDTLEDAVAAVPTNSDTAVITFLGSIVCPDGLVIEHKSITFDFSPMANKPRKAGTL